MTADVGGNLFILGSTTTPGLVVTPGAFTAPPSPSACPIVYVMKLRAADWRQIYGALLGPICVQHAPGVLAVDSDGAVYVAAEATVDWPLRNPVARRSSCVDSLPPYGGSYFGGSAVAKLSPDGSTLELGTYFEACGTPGLAVANDGSLYVGVASGSARSPARVLKLSPEFEAHHSRR